MWVCILCLCLAHSLFPLEDDSEGAPRRLGELVSDLFTLEQRRQGAVILHCIGLLYTFMGIALVCDECFVPALEVITEELSLTPDVAGATFMAAGGSAPEFFTSLIGTFTGSDVGTGTIIGSAVFNVLFVIGACALVSKQPLELTWFPLARDSIFYAISLVFVTVFFLDEKVMWWEALVLFLIYLAYVTFMVKNVSIEAWATGVQPALMGETASDAPAQEQSGEGDASAWAEPVRDDLEPSASLDGCRERARGLGESAGALQAAGTAEPKNAGPHLTRSDSEQGKCMESQKRNLAPKFRHHANQRLNSKNAKANDVVSLQGRNSISVYGCGSGPITSVAPKAEEEEEEALESRHPPPSWPVACAVKAPLPVGESPVMDPDEQLLGVVPVPSIEHGPFDCELPKDFRSTEEAGTELLVIEQDPSKGSKASCTSSTAQTSGVDKQTDPSSLQPTISTEPDSPLSLVTPGAEGSAIAWICYITKLPIMVCLVCTVPDVRRPGWRKYFVLMFIVSILWIAVFVYIMIWLVERVAETVGLADKDHIMGLTILAAGTSVPDFLTSAIVAREGHGDMAVSSSIGSNIFDVTVGLPVPWLLYAAAHGGRSVEIQAEGLTEGVMLLLAMLGLTVGSIMCHGWVMTKPMGVSMISLYVVFVVVFLMIMS